MKRVGFKFAILVGCLALVVYILPAGRQEYLRSEGELLLAQQIVEQFAKTLPAQASHTPSIGEVFQGFFVRTPPPPPQSKTAVALDITGGHPNEWTQRLHAPSNIAWVSRQQAEHVLTIRLTIEHAQLIGEARCATHSFVYSNHHRLESSTSLLAPVMAILIALLFRRVVPALLLGALAGCMTLQSYEPFGAVTSFFETYMLGVLTNSFNILIVVFIVSLIGMIGILSRGGGTQGLVNLFAGRTTSRRAARLTASVMGLAVFFDDYSNTVIVGNTMRAVTDRFKIAREKLAYIVDSTAAPVAGLAVVSTWIGYEISLYAGYIGTHSAYATFIESLPFRFYSLFTLALVLLNGLLSRDFGPMLAAERRAATEGKVVRDGAEVPISRQFDKIRVKEDVPLRWYNAAVPVGIVIALILGGLWLTGGGFLALQQEGIGALEPGRLVHHFGGPLYNGYVLAGAALIGSGVAAVLLRFQGILRLRESAAVWISGFRSFVLVLTILILAWSMASVCEATGTARYLGSALGQPPKLVVPAAIFLIGAAVSFSTGTSWGTMAILMPTTLPFVAGFDDWPLTVVCLGAVLEGSIFGDHCSPISDTTVLSSISSGCDHLDHVRTQIPYALTSALVALGCGYILTMLQVPWWVCLALGLTVLYGVLMFVGRPIRTR